VTAQPYLVTAQHAPRGVDVLELVGRRFAGDPDIALQWVTNRESDVAAPGNVAKFEATGWERVQESGVDVEVMGMLLMKRDRRAVEAEQQANRDKAEKNWTDAVERFGVMGGTVTTTWKPGPGK
jgi:hypothetical protein